MSAQLFTVHWTSINGPQYYISLEDLTRDPCDCEIWGCNCPRLGPSQLTEAEAARVVADLTKRRTEAKDGEAWDNAPHNVTMRKVEQ